MFNTILIIFYLICFDCFRIFIYEFEIKFNNKWVKRQYHFWNFEEKVFILFTN